MGYVGAAVTVPQAVNVYVFSISFPSFELFCICSWFSRYSSILLLWIIPELTQVYPSYFTWCVHEKMRVCLKKKKALQYLSKCSAPFNQLWLRPNLKWTSQQWLIICMLNLFYTLSGMVSFSDPGLLLHEDTYSFVWRVHGNHDDVSLEQ